MKLKELPVENAMAKATTGWKRSPDGNAKDFFPAYSKKPEDDVLITTPVKVLDRNVKTIVDVSTSTISISETKNGRSNSIPHYIKVNVVDSFSKQDIAYEARKMVSKNETVVTDGKTS